MIRRRRAMRKRKVSAGAVRRKFIGKKKGIKQPVQFFKRSVYTPNMYSASTLTDAPFAQVFRLNDLPGVSDFTALYDQYQIKAVKVTLMPKYDTATQVVSSGTVPNSAHAMNRVISCIDYDDNTALTSIGDALQYQNHKMTKGIRDHSRYLKPRCLLEAYGGIGLTHYMPRKNQWIDVANITTPHYGLKWIITQSPGIALSYDMKVDYYIACKNVR
nr:MAG: capsid protein [Owegonang virus 22]